MLPACTEPLIDLTASCWTLASFPKSGLPGWQVAKLSLYFPVVHHQDREGQGKSVHQSVYFHITQLLFHLVCREPHTVGLGIYCHSQVVSSRPAPQPAISCSVPGTEISTYSSWTLWGFCWNDLQFSQVLLHRSSAINCVSNASAHSRFSIVSSLAERTCSVMSWMKPLKDSALLLTCKWLYFCNVLT